MNRWKNRRPSGILLTLGLTGIMALSACGGETTVGGGGEASSAPASSAAASDAASPEAPAGDFPTPNGGELNLYNWTDYISPELLDRFIRCCTVKHEAKIAYSPVSHRITSRLLRGINRSS